MCVCVVLIWCDIVLCNKQEKQCTITKSLISEDKNYPANLTRSHKYGIQNQKKKKQIKLYETMQCGNIFFVWSTIIK